MKEVLADTNAELLDSRVVLQKNKDASFKLCKVTTHPPTHSPTHPPMNKSTVAHSNRLLLLHPTHPPTHPPTYLQDLAGQWEEWLWTVVREKSIYHTMNLFKSDVSGMLRGEGWVVKAGMGEARKAISGVRLLSSLSSTHPPATHSTSFQPPRSPLPSYHPPTHPPTSTGPQPLRILHALPPRKSCDPLAHSSHLL